MRRKLFLPLGILLFIAPAVLAVSDMEVRVGVLAKRGPEAALSQWQATANYLEETVPDYRFRIVPLGFDEIVPAVEQQEIDFVLSNSAFYVGLEHRFGVSRIATLINLRQDAPYTVFGGVVFTRADREDIARLEDLRHKTFMAVEESSLGGFIMAWGELRRNGMDPSKDLAAMSFGGTHDAVVYAVRDRQVDVGTVRTDTLERMAEEDKIDLSDFKIINQQQTGQHTRFPFMLSTRLYPEWPMAALRHTPESLTRKVAVALLRMPAECEAAWESRSAGWTVPSNYAPVHQLLRDLRLPPYEGYGRVTLEGVIRQYWHTLLVIFALLAVSVAVSTRALRLNRRLALSRAELLATHEQLEDRVQERTADLEREVAERGRVEEKLREKEGHLTFLANHDALTGLPNRVLLGDRLSHAISRAKRSGERIGLMFLDLDNFKPVNDSLGHAIGDQLLIEVAHRLRDSVRAGDTLARIGGDEFVVLMDPLKNNGHAVVVADKIRKTLSTPMDIEGHELLISTSTGIGVFPDHSDDPVDLIRCADTAMYRAKQQGRDRYQFYTPDMEANGSRPTPNNPGRPGMR